MIQYDVEATIWHNMGTRFVGWKRSLAIKKDRLSPDLRRQL